jgi:hypothetical protein
MSSNNRITLVYQTHKSKKLELGLSEVLDQDTEPSRILILNPDCTIHREGIESVTGTTYDGQLLFLADRETKNGAIPRTLGSEPDYRIIRDTIKNAEKGFKHIDSAEIPAGLPINHLVIYEGDDRCLPQFLNSCPHVHVWIVMDPTNDEKVGLHSMSVLEYLGYDTTQKEAEELEVPGIPENAMYGRAARDAKWLKTPLGYAYPAVLAAACGYGIKPSNSIRTNLYVALIGDVGTGKSVTSDRAAKELYGDGLGTPEWVEESTLSSDRGLFKAFASTVEEDAGQSRLLLQDEFRELLQKGQIQNSTLISVLCKLWNNNVAGVADKQEHSRMNLSLSILGNVKCKNTSEFSEVFSFDTAHGLYDRCLFGVPGSDSWEYTALHLEPASFDPTSPALRSDAYERVNGWGRGIDGRRRLKEMVLRVAYITAAMNQDSEVSDECLDAAFRFMEWQEKIRAVFAPAKGSNEYENCMHTILDAFEKQETWKWRDLCRKYNLLRKFPRSLKSVRSLLTSGQDAEIGYDPNEKLYFKKKQENQNDDAE